MPVIFSAVACILCRWEELGNINKPKTTERGRPSSRRSLRGKNYSERNKLFRGVDSQWCARGNTGRGAHWRECASSIVRTGKESRKAELAVQYTVRYWHTVTCDAQMYKGKKVNK